jgi:Tfp pilus assembly protein FimT
VAGNAGYTLVEMGLVVIALSLLTVMSYVKLQPALEHGRVNSAAAVVASDLQYAQLTAARQRKPVVVVVTTSTQSYVVRDRADATLIFRTRYMGSSTDYTLDEFTGTATSIDIFPTGVTPTTTTFTLGIHGYRRQVKFTKAGQVRVLKL